MIQRALFGEGSPETQPLQRGTTRPPFLRTQSLPSGTNQPPVPVPRMRSLKKGQVNMLSRGPRNNSDTPEYNAESVVQHFKEKLSLGRSENQLVQTQTDVQQLIQNRMEKIQEIQHSVETRKRNTEKEKSASVELFTDLIISIEKCQSELLKMMEEQQKAAEKQAEDLIKELQQEITDLKRRNTELEQLSHTDDHLHLIQTFASLYSLPHKNWTEISINSDVNVLPMNRALTLVKKTHETLSKKLSQTALKCALKFA
ncbi:hypothetical protein QQF64_020282, partial [Cirrhinus molitorella]